MKTADLGKISWVLMAAILIVAAILVVFAVLEYEDILVHALLTILILTLLMLFIVIMGRKTRAKLDYDGLVVSGAMLSVKIPYSDVTSVELRDEMKFGIRVGGYAGTKRLGGKFRNGEFGIYDLSAIVSTNRYIVVHSNSRKVLVFNLETEEETVEFYEKLSKWTGRGHEK